MTNRPLQKEEVLDWDITDAPGSEEPQPALPASLGHAPLSHRWPWAAVGLVMGVIVLVIVGALVYAGWTHANTRLAIEHALTQEAQVVEAHNIDELEAFYNADASDWGETYLRWALDKQSAPRPQPFLYPLTTTGQLTALEPFGPNIMQAEVARPFSNTQGQVLTFTTTYFFAFNADQWQRIAPPENFWGRQLAYVGPYLTLYYWEPDQALVDELGPYLTNLLTQVCAEWECPADYTYELYLTDLLPNPLVLADPPSDAHPTDPLFFDVLLTHRLYARESIFRMASPRIMGYPADNASRDYFLRAVGWLVLGQTSAHLGYREAQNFNPLLNHFYFGLLAETGARLGLDAPPPDPPLIIHDFSALGWLGDSGNWLSLTTPGARARLRAAWAIAHQLAQNESGGAEARLLQALWNENAPGLNWLANGLNLSLEAAQARFDGALNRAVQIQSQVSGQFDWALWCNAGPAVLKLSDGEARYLLTEADNSNFFYGGSVAWAADGRHLFVSGYGLLADMPTGLIRWISRPLASYPDQYTLLTDDLLAYIAWSSIESNSSPSSTLRFQHLRDPLQAPPAIENIWAYTVSPDQQFIAFAYRGDVDAAFTASRVRVIPAAGGPLVWEGAGVSPHWAPDGRQLIYTEYDSSGQVLAFQKVDLDTGESREVMNLAAFVPPLEATYAEAVWSPTGEWLAVVTSSQSSANQLWLIRPDGGKPRLLITSQDYIGPPRFSADGQFVASLIYPPDSSGVLQISAVTTGESVQTIDKLSSYDWSPTGHELALARHDGLYRLTDPAAEAQLVNQSACYSVTWNPNP